MNRRQRLMALGLLVLHTTIHGQDMNPDFTKLQLKGNGHRQDSLAVENAERFLRGAQVAARRLRAIGPQYEASARHYDRIAELFLSAARGKGEVHYAAIIGDLDKQRAHADTVLVPVRAELAAAAAAMEAALGSAPAPE